jgi:putative ABC transport system permease protein
MALGSQRRDVLFLVVKFGLRLALAGVGIGLAASLVLTRFLQSMLFEVKPTDPVTFAAVTILLVLVSLAACFIPARRAMGVDPMIALRYE